MNLVDLTIPVTLKPSDKTVSIVTEELHLTFGDNIPCTGVVHEFKYSSMSGTYIDFPGHVKETDDGMHAMNYPVEKLFRIKSAVIHLNRESGSGGVSAEELMKAAGKMDKDCEALIINALGKKKFNEIEERSVFLDRSAVDWINSLGIHIIVSDIYESQAKHGVFFYLFENEVSTVCCPVNLHLLTAPVVKLSCFFIPHDKAVQLPCRLIAEF